MGNKYNIKKKQWYENTKCGNFVLGDMRSKPCFLQEFSYWQFSARFKGNIKTQNIFHRIQNTLIRSCEVHINIHNVGKDEENTLSICLIEYFVVNIGIYL